jgi:hypothetical protein
MEANFDACWQCGTTANGTPTPEFRSVNEEFETSRSDNGNNTTTTAVPPDGARYTLRTLFVCVTLIGLALSTLLNWKAIESFAPRFVRNALITFSLGALIAYLVRSIRWFWTVTNEGHGDD